MGGGWRENDTRGWTTEQEYYPHQALHVCRLNEDVDQRNEYMLSKLMTTKYAIKAGDAIIGQTKHVNLASLSSKIAETGGLHGVLKIACGARVMLTTNVDVSDGLVNGALCVCVYVCVCMFIHREY